MSHEVTTGLDLKTVGRIDLFFGFPTDACLKWPDDVERASELALSVGDIERDMAKCLPFAPPEVTGVLSAIAINGSSEWRYRNPANFDEQLQSLEEIISMYYSAPTPEDVDFTSIGILPEDIAESVQFNGSFSDLEMEGLTIQEVEELYFKKEFLFYVNDKKRTGDIDVSVIYESLQRHGGERVSGMNVSRTDANLKAKYEISKFAEETPEWLRERLLEIAGLRFEEDNNPLQWKREDAAREIGELCAQVVELSFWADAIESAGSDLTPEECVKIEKNARGALESQRGYWEINQGLREDLRSGSSTVLELYDSIFSPATASDINNAFSRAVWALANSLIQEE